MLSLVKTTIAPASRSSAIWVRLTSRVAAWCSGVRLPWRKGSGWAGRCPPGPAARRSRCRRIPGPGGYQDPAVGPGSAQDFLVAVPSQTEVGDVGDLVRHLGEYRGQARAEAHVEQEPYAVVRRGTCRSLTAMAANSRLALTSSVTRG